MKTYYAAYYRKTTSDDKFTGMVFETKQECIDWLGDDYNGDNNIYIAKANSDDIAKCGF